MQHLIDFAHVAADIFRSTSSIRRRPRAGGFSLVEHAWHLADLETDAYSVRIARVLAESDPHFADFNGLAVANERRYIDKPIEPAIERFIAVRTANVARLRNVS